MTMRPSDPLIRAWLALVALSALATGVSLLRPDAPAWAATAAGAAIFGAKVTAVSVQLSSARRDSLRGAVVP